MNCEIEPLLEQLLAISLDLERHVLGDDQSPESWGQLLEQRQAIIDRLSACLRQGAVFTAEQKERYLKQAYAIDQRLLPVISRRKNELAQKLNSLQMSKQANKQYSGYARYTPYGAFFDKKK